MNCKRFYFGLLILVGLVNVSNAEDKLLPEGLNPVQAGVIVPRDVESALSIFDSENSSKRHYDHIYPLDGITLGLGHYPQAGMRKFFQALSTHNNGLTYKVFVRRMTEYFNTDPNAWKALSNAAELDETRQVNVENVNASLKATIFNAAFMERYKKNCKQVCKPKEADFYHEHEQWALPALKYSFRDIEVVKWQVEYWDNYLLEPSRQKAERAGLKSEAGLIGVASAQSSAKTWGTAISKASEKGELSTKGITWQWNTHPFISNPTEEQLEDWRLLARWQWYCAKKGKIRNRSRTYYNLFLKDKWILPSFSGGRKGLKDPENWDPARVKMR